MTVRRRQNIFAFLSLFLFTLVIGLLISQVFAFTKSHPIKEITTSLPTPTISPQSNFEEVTISRIIDGDTVVDNNNRKIRLIGINTPEISKPNGQLCFGKLAAKKTSELLLNQKVRLEKDISETDKYGRLLRYIWLNDQLINQILVKQGFAQVDTFPPDVKYQQLFVDTQKVAKDQKIGLWSGGQCD